MANDFAPKQDWESYEASVEAGELDRTKCLTPKQKFEKYASLFNLVHSGRPLRDRNDPLEIQRWNEKLQLRKVWVQSVLSSSALKTR